jgi:hypothetical protein
LRAFANVVKNVVIFVSSTSWSANFQVFIVVLGRRALNTNSIDSVESCNTITCSCSWVVDFVGLADNQVADTALQS